MLFETTGSYFVSFWHEFTVAMFQQRVHNFCQKSVQNEITAKFRHRTSRVES